MLVIAALAVAGLQVALAAPQDMAKATKTAPSEETVAAELSRAVSEVSVKETKTAPSDVTATALSEGITWSQTSAPVDPLCQQSKFPFSAGNLATCYSSVCGVYLTPPAALFTDGSCSCMTKCVGNVAADGRGGGRRTCLTHPSLPLPPFRSNDCFYSWSASSTGALSLRPVCSGADWYNGIAGTCVAGATTPPVTYPKTQEISLGCTGQVRGRAGRLNSMGWACHHPRHEHSPTQHTAATARHPMTPLEPPTPPLPAPMRHSRRELRRLVVQQHRVQLSAAGLLVLDGR